MMPNVMEKALPKNKEERKISTVLQAKDLTISYNKTVAVNNISISLPERQITAIIGPSGCGKSTLLRSFNRMNDFVPGANLKGQVMYRGTDLYGRDVDPVEVRRKIGMVFQKPNPFPKSIFENVSWGPLINGFRKDIHERVEQSLRRAALWDEVKDRLNNSALTLSGGQQQRLCMARALAMEPEVILMDEPPRAALRYKPDSSMRIALQLVQSNQASVCVSAGNTGALMALAHYILKMLPGMSNRFFSIARAVKSVAVPLGTFGNT